MKFTYIARILAATALLSAIGCDGGGTRIIDASSGAPRQAVPAIELVAMARPPIPDLPVPIGFSLDEAKSLDFTVVGGRFANHRYEGKADKLTVKRFYEQQMPVNRWVMTTSMFVSGDVKMDFEKDTERCWVIITSKGVLGKICIEVQLWSSGPLRTQTSEQK